VLLLFPIFSETSSTNGDMPRAAPEELAEAIVSCVQAGARVLNVSAALAQPSSKAEHELEEALDYAARQGAIVVAAAGNQGMLGSSAITRHPGVIPVAAFDPRGRPLGSTNLGNSLGRRGLGAPGQEVISLGTDGKPYTLSGTSAAAPFVTGAIALLWSEFPVATAAEVRSAITQASSSGGRTTVVPPLLDAWAAYHRLKAAQGGR
jgi:subtilisin family serine protease